MTRPTDLLQGTLDLLILKTLSWGPAHGYAVARWIEQLTGEVLRIGEGSLYPALHRLEERGLGRIELAAFQHQATHEGLPPDDEGPAAAPRRGGRVDAVRRRRL